MYIQVASGSQANKPELQKNSESAAAGIAKYMREKGIETIDANLLTQWATNADGNVPPEIRTKAQFLLANPVVLAKMESSDGTALDGISTLHNLDQAAQGRVDFKGLPESQRGELFEDHQEPAAILAKYMREKGIGVMDMNAIYLAATKPGDEIPSDVKKALTYILGNPKAFAEIEAIKGAAKDQLISADDFEKASAMDSPRISLLSGNQLAHDRLENIVLNRSEHNLYTQNGQGQPTLGEGAVRLAEGLEKFMTDNNIGLMSKEGLQNMTTDPKVSAADKRLAQTLLDASNLFELFETQGGAAKDNLISIGDLKRVQQGQSVYRAN
jgi:hypothetical protein